MQFEESNMGISVQLHLPPSGMTFLADGSW
jgi:hypothetical protein